MIYGFAYKYLKDFINDSTMLTDEELKTLEFIEKRFRIEKEKMVEVFKIPKKEIKTMEFGPKADSILAKIENRLQKAKDELAKTAQEAGFLALSGELITLELQEKAEKLQLKIEVYNEIKNEVTNE